VLAALRLALNWQIRGRIQNGTRSYRQTQVVYRVGAGASNIEVPG
jgi:hypothetical protein